LWEEEVKGWIWSRCRRVLYEIAYRGWLPRPWIEKLSSAFWDSQAELIYEKWGHGEAPAPLVQLIEHIRPNSILDVGCGAGQLFALYQRYNISKVLGVDISTEALAIAAREHPQIQTLRVELQKIDLPAQSYDLIVSNRVLQSIGPKDIEKVIGRLCTIGRIIYLNELADSDGGVLAFSVAKHDYNKLFGVQGWQLLAEGLIQKQTYKVFGAPLPGRAEP
jgi:SAM-dependent methyltransferase